MILIDEIHSFARDYINDKSTRTNDRKKKIREAYKTLTGKTIKVTCSTCYIEALFEIINNTTMATKKGYELKLGVLLESFGHPEKACTNNELTDELAEWHLNENPGKAIYFSRMPVAPKPFVPPVVKIIPPKQEAPVDMTPEKIIESITEPKVKKPKTKK